MFCGGSIPTDQTIDEQRISKEKFVSAIYFCMYFLALCLVGFVTVYSLWRSAFGILLASTLIWFLIGACVYPLSDLLGIVKHGGEVRDFIGHNGEPGLGAAVHILLASIGIFVGYVYRPQNGLSHRAVKWASATFTKADNSAVWRYSILLGICSYIVYFYFVGIDVALINAAAARSGEFDGFGENQSFMFLKTLASIGFVATCFLPIAILEKRRLSILAYGLLILTAYTNTISRSLILTSVIVPILIYTRLKWDTQKRANKSFSSGAILGLVPFALLVLIYGKVMGQFISYYLTGRDYPLAEAVGDESVWNTVLNGFAYIWVSVQAGVNYFFQAGFPLFTDEPFLATFFGFIPSRILSYLGGDSLYYGNAAVQIACVNSGAFGYTECTVPPMAWGYSAYVLPGIGGFLIGFLKMRVYSSIETLWISIQLKDYSKLWTPYFLFGAATSLFTFIPSAQALVMPQLLWVLVLLHLPRKSSPLRRTVTAN
jgi:hypothetical protein